MLVRKAARTVPAVPLNSTKVRAALTWMPVKLWFASQVVTVERSRSEGPKAVPKVSGVSHWCQVEEVLSCWLSMSCWRADSCSGLRWRIRTMRLRGVASARVPWSNSGLARGWVLPERVVTRASSTAWRMRERGAGGWDCADAGAEVARSKATVVRADSRVPESVSDIRGIESIPAAQTGRPRHFLAGKLKHLEQARFFPDAGGESRRIMQRN